MASRIADGISFISGALVDRQLCFLLACDDEAAEKEIDHSVFLVWNRGRWKMVHDIVPWNCIGFCTEEGAGHRALAIGEWGEIAELDSQGSCTLDVMRLQGAGPDERGPLRKVRTIDAWRYACGTDRQVYRSKDGRMWESFGPANTTQNDEISTLESIDGSSSSNLYAVGGMGEIWHFDGKRWTQQDSPVNAMLNDVMLGPDGSCYICGRSGTVVRGRNGVWNVIDHDFQGEDFWSAAWFSGEVYFASLHHLYRLHGDSLQLVECGDLEAQTFYHLSSQKGALWSIGQKDLLAFDGSNWIRID